MADDLTVKGYSDAAFSLEENQYRLQSGYVFTLNGGAVSWKSSKQDTAADSPTKSEYFAASEAAKEAVWIKKFVTDLGVVLRVLDLVELFCDNNGAITQAKDPQ